MAAETADSLVVEEDADLMLGVEEPEAWNVTVDRKVGSIAYLHGLVHHSTHGGRVH